MILHASPNRGGAYSIGGGVLWRSRSTLAEAEAKREVGENDEEVKQREDKHDKTKFTPLLFIHA